MGLYKKDLYKSFCTEGISEFLRVSENRRFALIAGVPEATFQKVAETAKGAGLKEIKLKF